MTSRGLRFVLAALLTCLGPVQATAQETVSSGLAWMTGFPSTWNAGAPKLVSDGLFYYAVFCGRGGSSSFCTVARKRGDGSEPWTFSSRIFISNQPATVVIDRKGRLNIFYNNLQLFHLRLDHPSVDLADWTVIPTGFAPQVGYIHASYDAVMDQLLVTFNETSTWQLHLARKVGEQGWTISPLPPAPLGSIYLYARTATAQGRYFVLAGQHTYDGPNFAYTAATLLESNSATGPWTSRELYRVFGNNLGVPYQNWVLANDLQLDAAGRPRALLHITENGSGHGNARDGVYLLREEDGYAPRLIGSGIEDGFTLYVDPSGVHLAFVRDRVQVAPFLGGIRWYRSNDNGATWQQEAAGYAKLVNPALVDLRSGSMIGPNLRFLASDHNLSTGAFDAVMFAGAALPPNVTADRYDYEYTDTDGTTDYIRAFRDVPSGRFSFYIYDRHPDLSYSLNHTYTAGSYYQVYSTSSNGAYRYYNSDGADISYAPLTLSALSPSSVPAGSAPSLVVTGTGFKPGSLLRFDGVARATTYVSSTALSAAIVTNDVLVAGGSRSITVVNPDGEISSALTLHVDPSPATLVPTATTVAAGGLVTFTLASGPANRSDWVGWFCPLAAADTGYLEWKYLNNSRTTPAAGVTAATITFTAPSGVNCNARLFVDNGFAKLVTSATVTVAPPIAPAPATATLTPASVVAGTATSILVNGANFVAASVVHVNGAARATAFVSTSQLRVSVLAGDVPTVGVSAPIVVVTPAPGGGTSNAVALLVSAGPTIVAGLANVPPSATGSFTIADGPGNPTDWVGWFCPASEPDFAYIDWFYLNGTKVAPTTGLTAGTVSFTVPAGGGGSCEARLFANNGFRKLASVAVTAIDVNWMHLSIEATPNAPVGTFGVTYYRSSGVPGTVSLRDWVGLFCPATGPDSIWVDWMYLNNSKTAPTSAGAGYGSATLTTSLPPGTKCQARLFSNNGLSRVLTSWVVTVPTLPAPTLTPTSLSVGPASAMTVAVANGPGNLRDWVGLSCPASSGSTTYVDWKYLGNSKTPPGAGLVSATITFTAPAAATTCQFRLFANDGFTLLAASDVVIVQ